MPSHVPPIAVGMVPSEAFDVAVELSASDADHDPRAGERDLDGRLSRGNGGSADAVVDAEVGGGRVEVELGLADLVGKTAQGLLGVAVLRFQALDEALDDVLARTLADVVVGVLWPFQEVGLPVRSPSLPLTAPRISPIPLTDPSMTADRKSTRLNSSHWE